MDPTHVQPLVDRWAGPLGWSDAQRGRARDRLLEIARANGGEVVEDEPIDAELVAEHVELRALGALDRTIRRIAGRLASERARPRHRIDAPDMEDLPGGLEGSTWSDAVDINTASAAELEALPAIGTVLAGRILQLRNARGRIASLDELDEIEGIGEAAIESLRDRVYFGRDAAPPLTTPELDAFLARPGFDRYVELVAALGGGFGWGSHGDAPDRHVLAVLDEVATETAVDPHPPHARVPGTRASDVRTSEQARRTAEKLEHAGTHEVTATALLRNRRYRPFLEALLPTARTRLDVAVFFMRYDPKRDHPTDDAIAALVAARKRGVAVRVILDQDKLGDPFHSRFINQAAFDHLNGEGVEVRFDSADRLMHAKVVIVDDTDVVVGSHNWTAGSFESYDDTSVYLRSSEATGRYAAWFEELWQSLK